MAARGKASIPPVSTARATLPSSRHETHSKSIRTWRHSHVFGPGTPASSAEVCVLGAFSHPFSLGISLHSSNISIWRSFNWRFSWRISLALLAWSGLDCTAWDGSGFGFDMTYTRAMHDCKSKYRWRTVFSAPCPFFGFSPCRFCARGAVRRGVRRQRLGRGARCVSCRSLDSWARTASALAGFGV